MRSSPRYTLQQICLRTQHLASYPLPKMLSAMLCLRGSASKLALGVQADPNTGSLGQRAPQAFSLHLLAQKLAYRLRTKLDVVKERVQDELEAHEKREDG